MASTAHRSTAQDRFAPRKLLWVGPLTILVAAVVNMALTGLFPAAGMNLHIFWTMLTMHVVSALITVGLLTTLAAERQ